MQEKDLFSWQKEKAGRGLAWKRERYAREIVVRKR